MSVDHKQPTAKPVADKGTQVLDLSSLPENVRVQIQTDEPPVKGVPVRKELSNRSLGTIISAAIGSVIGYAGTKLYVNSQMFDFETEVLKKTRGNILGRSGLGAAVSENGFAAPGFAAGLSSGEIHLANAAELAQSGKYGSMPKFIYKNLGGPGGKDLVALGGALVVGGAAAALAYSMLGSPDRSRKGDWTERAASEPPSNIER